MKPSGRCACRDMVAILSCAALCLGPTADHLFVMGASWPLDSRGLSHTALRAKAKKGLDAAARTSRANQMNPNHSVGAKAKRLDAAALRNRANQMNPNSSHRKMRQSSTACHANQLNPNHAQYFRSRGHPPPLQEPEASMRTEQSQGHEACKQLCE